MSTNITRPKRVYIEHDIFNTFNKMFLKEGWEITTNIFEADLIQFTGGKDISPSLYGQPKHPQTINDVDRDKKEVLIYKLGLKLGIPMAGVCRGAQFLNVMNNGTLWQHIVNNKHNKPHDALDLASGEVLTVSSTHHQMMIPPNNKNTYAKLLVSNLGCTKEKMTKNETIISVIGHKEDIEALIYYDTCCLCFQPHPEYDFFTPTKEKYFKYLSHIL